MYDDCLLRYYWSSKFWLKFSIETWAIQPRLKFFEFFIFVQIECHSIEMHAGRMMVSRKWWYHSLSSGHLVPWAKLQNFALSKSGVIWKREVWISRLCNWNGSPIGYFSRHGFSKFLHKFSFTSRFSWYMKEEEILRSMIQLL